MENEPLSNGASLADMAGLPSANAMPKRADESMLASWTPPKETSQWASAVADADNGKPLPQGMTKATIDDYRNRLKLVAQASAAQEFLFRGRYLSAVKELARTPADNLTDDQAFKEVAAKLPLLGVRTGGRDFLTACKEDLDIEASDYRALAAHLRDKYPMHEGAEAVADKVIADWEALGKEGQRAKAKSKILEDRLPVFRSPYDGAPVIKQPTDDEIEQTREAMEAKVYDAKFYNRIRNAKFLHGWDEKNYRIGAMMGLYAGKYKSIEPFVDKLAEMTTEERARVFEVAAAYDKEYDPGTWEKIVQQSTQMYRERGRSLGKTFDDLFSTNSSVYDRVRDAGREADGWIDVSQTPKDGYLPMTRDGGKVYVRITEAGAKALAGRVSVIPTPSSDFTAPQGRQMTADEMTREYVNGEYAARRAKLAYDVAQAMAPQHLYSGILEEAFVKGAVVFADMAPTALMFAASPITGGATGAVAWAEMYGRMAGDMSRELEYGKGLTNSQAKTIGFLAAAPMTFIERMQVGGIFKHMGIQSVIKVDPLFEDAVKKSLRAAILRNIKTQVVMRTKETANEIVEESMQGAIENVAKNLSDLYGYDNYTVAEGLKDWWAQTKDAALSMPFAMGPGGARNIAGAFHDTKVYAKMNGVKYAHIAYSQKSISSESKGARANLVSEGKWIKPEKPTEDTPEAKKAYQEALEARKRRMEQFNISEEEALELDHLYEKKANYVKKFADEYGDILTAAAAKAKAEHDEDSAKDAANTTDADGTPQIIKDVNRVMELAREQGLNEEDIITFGSLDELPPEIAAKVRKDLGGDVSKLNAFHDNGKIYLSKKAGIIQKFYHEDFHAVAKALFEDETMKGKMMELAKIMGLGDINFIETMLRSFASEKYHRGEGGVLTTEESVAEELFAHIMEYIKRGDALPKKELTVWQKTKTAVASLFDFSEEELSPYQKEFQRVIEEIYNEGVRRRKASKAKPVTAKAVADAKAALTNAARWEGYDIRGDVAKALTALAEGKVDDPEMTPTTRVLLDLFKENKDAPKFVADVLKRYAKKVMAVDEDAADNPTPDELLTMARNEAHAAAEKRAAAAKQSRKERRAERAKRDMRARKLKEMFGLTPEEIAKLSDKMGDLIVAESEADEGKKNYWAAHFAENRRRRAEWEAGAEDRAKARDAAAEKQKADRKEAERRNRAEERENAKREEENKQAALAAIDAIEDVDESDKLEAISSAKTEWLRAEDLEYAAQHGEQWAQDELEKRMKEAEQAAAEADLPDRVRLQDAVKRFKIPLPRLLREHNDPMAGEAQIIYDQVKGNIGMLNKLFTSQYRYLDNIRESINEGYGFTFETPAELLEALNNDLHPSAANHVYAFGGNGNQMMDYSMSPSQARAFRRQLRMFIEGYLPDGHVFDLGSTPEALKLAGADDMPLEMSKRVLNHVKEDHPDLPLESLRRLPESLADPIAVFQSATVPNALTVLTEILDENGNNAMAAVHLNYKKGTFEVNDIRSIYGRKKGEYVSFIRDGLLLYVNTKKVPRYVRSPLVQFHGRDLSAKALNKEKIYTQENLSQQEKKNIFDLTGVQYSLSATPAEASEHRALYDAYKAGDKGAWDKAVALVRKVAKRAGYLWHVWHGTRAAPYENADASGKNSVMGQGAQSHGTGLYMAEAKNIAEGYSPLGTISRIYIGDKRIDEFFGSDYAKNSHSIDFVVESIAARGIEKTRDYLKDYETTLLPHMLEIKDSEKIIEKVSTYLNENNLNEGDVKHKETPAGTLFEWLHNMTEAELLDEDFAGAIKDSPVGDKYKRAWEQDILPRIKELYGYDKDEMDMVVKELSPENKTKDVIDSIESLLGGESFLRKIMLKYGIRGITYVGGQDGRCYVSFEGGATVKRADPFTFDKNGELVPLDQRFNSADPRMSYSLSDASDERLRKIADLDIESVVKKFDAIKQETLSRLNREASNNINDAKNQLDKWVRSRKESEWEGKDFSDDENSDDATGWNKTITYDDGIEIYGHKPYASLSDTDSEVEWVVSMGEYQETFRSLDDAEADAKDLFVGTLNEKPVDNADDSVAGHIAAYEVFNAMLEDVADGILYSESKTDGSMLSSSKYVKFSNYNDSFKIRFSDHILPSKYRQPDVNIFGLKSLEEKLPEVLSRIKGLASEQIELNKDPRMSYSLSEENAPKGGVQKAVGVVYPDASREIAAISYSLSNRMQSDFEAILKKRRADIDDDERARVLKEIGNFKTPKQQKAALHWYVKGAIRLPEDAAKVEQALEYSERAKADPLTYSSPMALMDALHEFKPKEKPIDPDTVKELTGKRELGHGVVVYDVPDTKAAQKAMRRIINTHFGEDANPWCVLQGDGKGNLSGEAWTYWKHYSDLPKQVAFRNGKLLAFMATDNGRTMWWDRQDSHSYGIPLGAVKLGDRLGRKRNAELSEDGDLKYIGNAFIGNREKGAYTAWHGDSEQKAFDRLPDGTRRGWHENGQMKYENLPDGTRRGWHENGQMSYEYLRDSTHREWHENGQLGLERFPDGTTHWWNEDGKLSHEELPDGTMRYWYKNGRLQKETLPDFTTREWYRTGKLKHTGIPNGTYRNWYENGQLSFESFSDGTTHGWDENGKYDGGGKTPHDAAAAAKAYQEGNAYAEKMRQTGVSYSISDAQVEAAIDTAEKEAARLDDYDNTKLKREHDTQREKCAAFVNEIDPNEDGLPCYLPLSIIESDFGGNYTPTIVKDGEQFRIEYADAVDMSGETFASLKDAQTALFDAEWETLHPDKSGYDVKGTRDKFMTALKEIGFEVSYKNWSTASTGSEYLTVYDENGSDIKIRIADHAPTHRFDVWVEKDWKAAFRWVAERLNKGDIDTFRRGLNGAGVSYSLSSLAEETLTRIANLDTADALSRFEAAKQVAANTQDAKIERLRKEFESSRNESDWDGNDEDGWNKSISFGSGFDTVGISLFKATEDAEVSSISIDDKEFDDVDDAVEAAFDSFVVSQAKLDEDVDSDATETDSNHLRAFRVCKEWLNSLLGGAFRGGFIEGYSNKSKSRYIEFKNDGGKSLKLRFSDHHLPEYYAQADIDMRGVDGLEKFLPDIIERIKELASEQIELNKDGGVSYSLSDEALLVGVKKGDAFDKEGKPRKEYKQFLTGAGKGSKLVSIKKFLPAEGELAKPIIGNDEDDTVRKLAAWLKSLPNNGVVTAFDGKKINFLSDEDNNFGKSYSDPIERRVWHAIATVTDETKKKPVRQQIRIFDSERAKMFVNSVNTVVNGQVRVKDQGSEFSYVLKYKNGVVHKVVVTPEGKFSDSSVFTTQYRIGNTSKDAGVVKAVSENLKKCASTANAILARHGADIAGLSAQHPGANVPAPNAPVSNSNVESKPASSQPKTKFSLNQDNSPSRTAVIRGVMRILNHEKFDEYDVRDMLPEWASGTMVADVLSRANALAITVKGIVDKKKLTDYDDIMKVIRYEEIEDYYARVKEQITIKYTRDPEFRKLRWKQFNDAMNEAQKVDATRASKGMTTSEVKAQGLDVEAQIKNLDVPEQDKEKKKPSGKPKDEVPVEEPNPEEEGGEGGAGEGAPDADGAHADAKNANIKAATLINRMRKIAEADAKRVGMTHRDNIHAEVRATYQRVLMDAAKALTASTARQQIALRIKGLRDVRTPKSLDKIAAEIAERIYTQQIRDTKEELTDKVWKILRKKAKRVKATEREDKRTLPALVQKRLAFIKRMMMMTEAELMVAYNDAKHVFEGRKAGADNSDMPSAESDADKLLEAKLTILDIDRFSGWKKRSVGQMSDAIEWLENYIESETAAHQESVERKKELHRKERAIILSALRQSKHNAKRDGVIRSNGRKLMTMVMPFDTLFDELALSATGETRKAFERLRNAIVNDVFRASEAVENEKMEAKEKLASLLREAYGTDAAALARLMREDKNLDKFSDQERPTPMTLARLMQLYVTACQEQYIPNAYAWRAKKLQRDEVDALQKELDELEEKYNDFTTRKGEQWKKDRERMEQLDSEIAEMKAAAVKNYIAEIEKVLTPQDMKFINLLRKHYHDERPALSAAAKKIVGLPIDEPDPLYMPAKMMSGGGMEEGGVAVKAFPAAYTPRVPHQRDFDESADVVTMYLDRCFTNSQFKHFSEIYLTLRGIFAEAEIQRLIKDTCGDDTWELLKGFINDICAGERAPDKMMGSNIASSINGLFAWLALAANLPSAIRQILPGVFTWGEWIGTGKVFKNFSTAWTPAGVAAMKEIVNSESMRRRWDAGNIQVLNELLAKPDRNKIFAWVKRNGIFFHKVADAFSIIVIGQGLYRAGVESYLRKGMSLAFAKKRAMSEMWNLAERSQASGLLLNQAVWQRRGGAIGLAIGTFTSPPQLAVSKTVGDIRRAIGVGIKSPEGRSAAFKAMRTWAVNTFLAEGAYAVGLALTNAIGGDDWDEKDTLTLILAMMTGPFGGLYIFGKLAISILDKRPRGYMPMESFGRVGRLSFEVAASALQGDGDATAKDVDRLLMALFAPYRLAKKIAK